MEIDIKWPEADLRALATQIERAQLGLGKSLQESLVWAGILLAKGAGVRTKSAPKKRRLLPNTEEKFKNYPYYREIWDKGPEKAWKYYLKDRSDITYETIKNSGLAKKSWLWMIPGLRGNGSSNFASSVSKRGSAFTFEIEMANMLSYITKALKESDGQILLNEALGKTASRMEKIIDNRLKK